MTWFKVKPDFATLARMHWVEGENLQNLARFFKLSEHTIRGYLREIRKDQTLVSLDLESNETAAIFTAIKREEHGQSHRINL